MAASLAAIDLAASQGAAVLGLLERALVPPRPEFYTLFYDYVSGVESLFACRVRDILNAGETDGSAGQRLYSEFVAPYRTDETAETAVARIATRLRTLDQLLRESAESCAEQAVSLNGAAFHLSGQALERTLVLEWVRRLQQAARSFAWCNARLDEELRDATAELADVRLQLEGSRRESLCDPLTGLANRAGLDAALVRMLSAQRDRGGEHACAIVDIDHFKSLNDSYGHRVGDEILRIVARALRASVRDDVVVGRLGGDEFVLLMPGSDLADARAVAGRFRHELQESDLKSVLGAGVLGSVTASTGIAAFRRDDTITGLIGRADQCLYLAKHRGRNRIVCEGDPES